MSPRPGAGGPDLPDELGAIFDQPPAPLPAPAGRFVAIVAAARRRRRRRRFTAAITAAAAVVVLVVGLSAVIRVVTPPAQTVA
ncbi:MAG TPA: hypothetical protein VLC50_01060, partial [Actinomycetes bacterium]|nr:hypothetical protein [Actinomycetes bacterium]